MPRRILARSNTTTVSWIFVGLILVLVAYLSITRRDQTPAEVTASQA